MSSEYKGKICYLATMHQKEQAIRPAFEEILGCRLISKTINTDLLGTFTGEIERRLSPLECAKEKCRLILDLENGDLYVANEGSFGPHPFVPFIHADHEIIHFVDRKLDFHLSVSKIFTQTNYNRKIVGDFEEVIAFAKEALFPSHALILRSDPLKIYKGIQSEDDLKKAFFELKRNSPTKRVCVETDMRAHMNPTRMQMIADLAQIAANRLATVCPMCKTPGWGMVGKEYGLPCQACGSCTELPQSEIFGCCKCSFQQPISSNTQMADPRYCPFCNP